MQTMTHNEQRFHEMWKARGFEIPNLTAFGERPGHDAPLTPEHVELMRARLIHDDSVPSDPGENFAEDVYLDQDGRILVGMIGGNPGTHAITAHHVGGAGWLTITATRSGAEEGRIDVLDLDDPAEVACAASTLWDWAFV